MNPAAARRVGNMKNLTPGGDAVRSVPSNDKPMSSMFGNNTIVSGGQFTIAETMNNKVKSSGAEAAFKLLQKRVATAAFHNSSQHVDPPRCHPHTREEILKTIYDWIIQSEDREKWLLWLNGAAGAGKSAIMQSLAEKCALTTLAIASFFFFRGDHTRNTTAPLVATLAYQLIRAIPETKDEILLAIERDPLIFNQSLKSQLQLLIIQPLLRLPRELQRLFVVFIDGLDECDDRVQQSNLVKVLGNISWRRDIPIIFLVASRREYQIVAAFGLDPVADLHTTVPLDNLDINITSDDIRRFLVDKFNELKDTHLNRRFLPPSWPPISAIEEILAKSSGQFVFASVVINYISFPRNNPARQLDLVLDIRLREASSQNPFAHLDALYHHIFSQVKDLDKVLDILAFQMLLDWNLSILEPAFRLAFGEAEVCLADLAAVITCNYHGRSGIGEMEFLHASLPDFLQDKSRSGSYHIDLNEYGLNLLCMFLEREPSVLDPPSLTEGVVSYQEALRLDAIGDLIEKTQPRMTDRLHSAFMNFTFKLYFAHFSIQESYVRILKYLHQQEFYDQGGAYCHVINMYASEYGEVGVTLRAKLLEDAQLNY